MKGESYATSKAVCGTGSRSPGGENLHFNFADCVIGGCNPNCTVHYWNFCRGLIPVIRVHYLFIEITALNEFTRKVKATMLCESATVLIVKNWSSIILHSPLERHGVLVSSQWIWKWFMNGNESIEPSSSYFSFFLSFIIKEYLYLITIRSTFNKKSYLGNFKTLLLESQVTVFWVW